ncbi:hypothetical protein Tco_0019400 [Tanacetum coccineum]
MESYEGVNERQMQTIEEKVDTSKALDASLVDTERNIRPIYDEEPMAEVQTMPENQCLCNGQTYIGNLKFYNEERVVDHQCEQCHDKCPLPAKLTDNQITELSNQSLESENICLKKTVAQFQKDFLRMEAHCVNFELKYQNQALKEGQHGQFSKVKSNEAKIKHDIDVTETINIELEHKVAKLLKENETLKRHYKELSDSIKTIRAKTIEHTTSLIAKNDEFKAQLQEKGFAIVALKNELRKLTENSVNTMFAKSSILGKPVLQPHRNQSVVRQPTAFKFERPRILKPRLSSQVDVNNNLSKPVTTHYLPKERESAIVKPHHVIASSESRNSSKNMPRLSSNDMVHNHYLEEAKKKDTRTRIFMTNFNHKVIRWWRYPIPTEVGVINAHAQTTKIYYKHQDLIIKKAQVLKTKTSANSDIKDNSLEIKLWGRLLASFQEDAKYEHVGQDTRSQDGKDDQD